jgi:hypothetical protein
MTRTIDPIIESALGVRSRLGRALVYLDRAAWMLGEAREVIGTQAGAGPIVTTCEILRGGTAQAAHDLALLVCSTLDPYPGNGAAIPAAPECPRSLARCPAVATMPDDCGDCEYAKQEVDFCKCPPYNYCMCGKPQRPR